MKKERKLKRSVKLFFIVLFILFIFMLFNVFNVLQKK